MKELEALAAILIALAFFGLIIKLTLLI